MERRIEKVLDQVLFSILVAANLLYILVLNHTIIGSSQQPDTKSSPLRAPHMLLPDTNYMSTYDSAQYKAPLLMGLSLQ